MSDMLLFMYGSTVFFIFIAGCYLHFRRGFTQSDEATPPVRLSEAADAS